MKLLSQLDVARRVKGKLQQSVDKMQKVRFLFLIML